MMQSKAKNPFGTAAQVALPELPLWLRELEQQADNPDSASSVSPAIEILKLIKQARAGLNDAALEIAKRFETGNIPGGANIVESMRWYCHAAQNGVVAAAMRLAHLESWEHPDPVVGGRESALLAINLTLDNRIAEKDDYTHAAMAARFLLNSGLSDGEVEAINALLDNAHFEKHPDAPAIAKKLRRLTCQNGQDGLSLTVLNAKIVEDNEFKAGIYRLLEKPLPLIPVPSDPEVIRETLQREFPWFEDINALVHRQLMAAQFGNRPAFKIRPLLLAGPPGVGKTSWAKRLAELCKVPYRTVMAAGSADSMHLRGLSRGWGSTRPGAVLQTMATEGIANPLILVDELDKASADSRNGRIWDVMLQLLEPASSRAYYDECLQLSCDLSWISWMATCNELGKIPEPLLDRFTVVLVKSPSPEYFAAIANGAINAYSTELGIDLRMLPELTMQEREVLQRCKCPREINRTVRLMLEQHLVQSRIAKMH